MYRMIIIINRVIIIIVKQKIRKIMSKKVELQEQQKPLYEWAEERMFSDDVSMFLQFCKQDLYEPMDVVSYGEFLTLNKKFENRV